MKATTTIRVIQQHKRSCNVFSPSTLIMRLAAAVVMMLASISIANSQDQLFSDSFEPALELASKWWTEGGDVVEGSDIRTHAVTPFGIWVSHI
ncbi:MAG: hypothetical protein QNJ40_19395, partial [Xanthomonadales bacterium]|nr:hypothetical protein [Xanthomonadales bacterium]